MRMLGNQFVTGQTIEEALKNSQDNEARGYRYSYDMLGEAALTMHDAAFYQSLWTAIHAIGKASNGRGIKNGPGISVKLSALHPRYSRAQRASHHMNELLPLLKQLLVLAKQYNIGLNIDARKKPIAWNCRWI